MRGSRVQLLVAAPSEGDSVSRTIVSACIYRDNGLCIVDKGQPRGQNRASLLGGVPERSKGSDCKSDGLAFVGSNPTPSTRQSGTVSNVSEWEQQSGSLIRACLHIFEAERILRRVWFNGRTSAFQAEGAGSIPATRSIERRPSRVTRRFEAGDPYSRKVYCSHSSVGRALPW
jgi:hypothetical protein